LEERIVGHQIVDVAVNPGTRGDRVTSYCHIPRRNSRNVYLQDVSPPLYLEHAGASVWHLRLVGHFRKSLSA
ncbi:hypothetical protein PMAYCL1PPCAC_20493, partial [Pristionchus mayeri]